MSTRNEIKAVLRENTKKAFELMEVGIKASGKKEFTANELARMTEGRLSAKSVASFLNCNYDNHSNAHKINYILDTTSLVTSGNSIKRNGIVISDITIPEYSIKDKIITRTYVNAEDENDVITLKKLERLYKF